MFNNALLMAAASAAASVPGRYVVDYSCRFDKDTPAYLSYTPSSAGDRRQITMSYWQKRGSIGGQQVAFQSGSTYWQFGNSNEEFNLLSDGSGEIKSTRIFRDPSAWYHFVISFDTEQNVPSNRIRVWVNGIPITDWSTLTGPTKDTDLSITNTVAQVWGVYGTSTYPMDGYLSQVCMIDGLALNATSFGEFDDNGVWRPIDITGLTFGTTGYLLDFADSSDLGNDVSGNNNDFTSSGLAAADQMIDTPTNNFCTMSPLDKNTNITLSDGNLTSTGSGGWHHGRGTLFASSGKWYYEWTPDSGSYALAGWMTNIGNDHNEEEGDPETAQYRGIGAGLGVTLGNQTAITDVANFAVDDVVMMAIDIDTGEVWVGVNGTWEDDEDPGAGGTPVGTWTSFTGTAFTPWTGQFSNANTFNFGQTAFAHTVPTGFSAWSTSNLPEPTIKNSKKYFDTILYEGNGSGQKVGQFQPVEESFTVGNSAMFDGSNDEMTHTFSSAGDRQKWTVSLWYKRCGALNSRQALFSASGSYLQLGPDSGTEEEIILYLSGGSGTGLSWLTYRRFGDESQWVNAVWALDTTESSAADRAKLYIDGVLVPAAGFNKLSNVDEDYEGSINNNIEHSIANLFTGAYHFNGYLAEIVFIDGAVHAASSFGEVDATTNRWVPKDVSGLTFGTNGFYLNMADKNDLGDDESGNGNDFTMVGMDTTNGSNQFYDTPTRNFATMSYGRSINETLTVGNLLATSGGATGQTRPANAFGLTSGKWYFEFLMVGGSTNERTMYITQDDVAVTATQIRSTTGHYSGYYSYDGDAMTPGVVSSTTGVGTDYGDTYTAADVISCAVDLDIGAIWWGKNGTWQNSATELEIEAGTLTNAAQINLASGRWYPTMQNNTTQASHANFGQHIYFDSTTLTLDSDAGGYFRHSVPDGFKAIHVDNFTESSSFISAFSWIKNRDATDSHMNFDRVRGPFSFWHANTDADIADNENTLTRFLKQGANIGEDVRVNTAKESFVYWDWFIEATGTGSANEDGSINTAATLVDTTCGISISKFTGTGANATVGHGLGVAPKFVILKHFDNSQYSSTVFHSNVVTPTTGYLVLDSNYAEQNNAAIWNSTIPTSSVVSLGTSAASNNSGTDYMMYCFAEIEGFSKFSSYTGNGTGSGGGPFSYTGFKPNFIMCKAVDRTSDWYISDIARNKFNSDATANRMVQYANLARADESGYGLQIFSNGFKQYDGAENNSSGKLYCYVAFAYNPFGGASTTPGTAF